MSKPDKIFYITTEETVSYVPKEFYKPLTENERCDNPKTGGRVC